MRWHRTSSCLEIHLNTVTTPTSRNFHGLLVVSRLLDTKGPGTAPTAFRPCSVISLLLDFSKAGLIFCRSISLSRASRSLVLRLKSSRYPFKRAVASAKDSWLVHGSREFVKDARHARSSGLGSSLENAIKARKCDSSRRPARYIARSLLGSDGLNGRSSSRKQG